MSTINDVFMYFVELKFLQSICTFFYCVLGNTLKFLEYVINHGVYRTFTSCSRVITPFACFHRLTLSITLLTVPVVFTHCDDQEKIISVNEMHQQILSTTLTDVILVKHLFIWFAFKRHTLGFEAVVFTAALQRFEK